MRKRIGLTAIVAMLATGVTAAAQAPGGDGWHVNGTLGMDLDKTTQTSILPAASSAPTQDYDTAGGDLHLNVSGFVANPLFLPFSITFSSEHGSNSLAETGYHDTMFAGTLSTTLLPSKPYPLRFYYTNTNFAANGSLFDQNSSTSTLGVTWALREPKYPNLYVGYTHSASDVYMATSLFNTNYKQGHAFINAQQIWRKWSWNAGFDNYDTVSNLPGGFEIPNEAGAFRETLRVFGARVERPFWGKKAEFHLENRSQWLDESFGGVPENGTTEIYTTADLHLQHTQKLSTSYFYTLERITSPPGLTPGQSAGVLLLLVPPTFVSHYGGARVDYQATKHVGLFEELHYQHLTPAGNEVEFRESLAESLTGADVRANWHHFDLSGEYIGHLQLMGTNFGNHTDTFSNEMHGRASRGDPRTLRLILYGDYSKLNLVDQLNGFSQYGRVGGEVETTWPAGVVWRLTAGYSEVEMLNLSGDVHQNGADVGAQVSSKRFALGYTHSLSDGAGALFPEAIGLRTLITVPLPVNDLVATPLLDRTTRLNAATVILRLHRNLDLSGDYRQESDFLATANFYFHLVEARLRYRLGKFTFEAGYGHYLNDTMSNNILSGLHTNQYRLRVARDFRLF
jgi:hypothetical protein